MYSNCINSNQKHDAERANSFNPKLKVCAGIVTFNPDLERLKENIDSICNQVDKVYICDNGSNNAISLKKLAGKYECVQVIWNKKNDGIAAALNKIAKTAKKSNYSYLLTLDQDSVSTVGMVATLMNEMKPGVGIVSPQVIDRNKESIDRYEEKLDGKVYEVKQAARKGILTSGALTDLDAWAYVNGFDEQFFIDYVDYDFNKRLLLEGFHLIRTGKTALIHECGRAHPTFLVLPRKGQNGRWSFERFYSFGHSPFRCYYKARNRILYSKKYKDCSKGFQFEGVMQIIPQILLTLLFEDSKCEKAKAFYRGIRDGINTKVPSYQVNKHLAVDKYNAS